jgi:hypothetical protein
MECVVSTTALFLLFYEEMLATTVQRNLRALGSIPAEGSSSRTIGGLPSKERATESFLLLPPLKVVAGLKRWFSRLSYLSCLSIIGWSRVEGIPLIRA